MGKMHTVHSKSKSYICLEKATHGRYFDVLSTSNLII